MKAMIPIPRSPDGWLVEITRAYRDAREAIPLAGILSDRVGEEELLAIAPLVTLKLRGIRRTRAARKKATDAALASYVGTTGGGPKVIGSPHLAFAFCYLASHFGLGLVAREAVEETMEYLERNVDRLESMAAE